MERAEHIRTLSILGIDFLALISPILISAFLVFFKGRGIPGRWVFLFAGPVLAYTILWVFTLIFIFPAAFFVVWLAPAFRQLYEQLPYWYPFAEWFIKHVDVIAPITVGLLSVWLVMYVWPRWSKFWNVIIEPVKN